MRRFGIFSGPFISPFWEARLFLLPVSCVFLFFFSGCAAVKEVAGESQANIAPPVIRVLGAESSLTDLSSDKSNYKMRQNRKPGIRLVLREKESEVETRVRRIASRAYLRLLSRPGVELIRPDKEQDPLEDFPGGEKSAAYLKRVEADGVVEVSCLEQGEGAERRLWMQAIIQDPFEGRQLAENKTEIEVLDRSPDRAHQLDFYNNRGEFRPLAHGAGPVVRLRGTSKGLVAFENLVRESVSGRVNVHSSIADATVYLVKGKTKKTLGRPPIFNYRLEEGLYRVEIHRRGYPAFKKNVWVRAGKLHEVYSLWPDEGENASLAVITEPSGLRLAVDGELRGNTPLYLSGMESGSYDVELSRANQDKEFEVLLESPVNIQAGGEAVRVFLVNYKESFSAGLLENDIWQLTSESGLIKYAPSGGLAFKSPTTTPVWQGLVSRNSYLGAGIAISLDVVPGSDNQLSFGVLSESESVLVDMKGAVFTLKRFKGSAGAEKPRSFEPLKKAATHRIEIFIDPADKKLNVSIDGDSVYNAPWTGSSSGRIAILTKPGSADGRSLARKLEVRSGRGIYDK